MNSENINDENDEAGNSRSPSNDKDDDKTADNVEAPPDQVDDLSGLEGPCDAVLRGEDCDCDEDKHEVKGLCP